MWTGVEVVEADVCSEEGKARLRAADIVVLHNVFEFFGDAEAVGRGWAVVRECVSRKGQVLPLPPSARYPAVARPACVLNS